jgi:prepilin-type N-terminal cleavage/methylation domain-containing protein
MKISEEVIESRVSAFECNEARSLSSAWRAVSNRKSAAFSLVELLIVIAIIAIMASIVISAFSNASADSRLVLVRQQQAVVQEAINSWLAYNSSGKKSDGTPRSLSSARTDYNTATTGLARLALVQAYLDDATYSHLVSNTSNADQVRSDAMVKSGQYLQITDWPSGSYPKVNLITP